MNEGIQLKMSVIGDHLETPNYLENIPDYEKKLKAWNYLQNPNRDKIIMDYMLRYKFPGPQNEGVDSYTASRIINKELGFDRTYVNTKGNLVFYNAPEIEDYYKDILGKDGMPLISKEVFKDAA